MSLIDILFNQGPWGAPPKNNGSAPQPDGSKNDRPNIEDLLRHKKSGGNRGGYRGGAGGGFTAPDARGFFYIGLAVVLLWLASGFYRVEPEENAVVLTFGKWTHTKSDPGLGYALPYPVQEAIKVNVAFDRRIEVGFREQTPVPAESQMLTGDENIIDINFIVLWRISDARDYLFRIRDPDLTVKKVAESAMRETIGKTQIQKALTEARADIEASTRELMQRILDEYESGVIINSVQLLRVDPPAQVVDAFDDVQRARTDRERLKNEAETYRNDIVPRARGEVQKLLQEAEAYKQSVIARAEGDASRFNSVLAAYRQSRDVTQRRLYLETMEAIMQKSRKIIVDEKNGTPVLPYMNIEQIKGNTK